jgi:hypothetical protein
MMVSLDLICADQPIRKSSNQAAYATRVAAIFVARHIGTSLYAIHAFQYFMYWGKLAPVCKEIQDVVKTQFADLRGRVTAAGH